MSSRRRRCRRSARTAARDVRRAARRGVGAKDLILGLIAQETSAGATGHVVEYAGEAIRALSMEGRMTVSNMSIEWGARAGLIAPDETTYRFLEGRPGVQEPFERASSAGRATSSDDGRGVRPRDHASTPRRSRRRSPGARTPARRRRSRAACPTPRRRGRAARARLHGPDGRRRAGGHSRSTASSSARARTAASATCARRPRSCAASASRPASRRSSCPGSMRGQGARPRPRASTASSPTRASSGATRAARCASA